MVAERKKSEPTGRKGPLRTKGFAVKKAKKKATKKAAKKVVSKRVLNLAGDAQPVVSMTFLGLDPQPPRSHDAFIPPQSAGGSPHRAADADSPPPRFDDRTKCLFAFLFGEDLAAWPKAADPDPVVGLIRAGLPVAVCDRFLAAGVLTLAELDAIVIPRRTLQHRRQKSEPLRPEESDRVIRFARIWLEAVAVFEDEENAGYWLRNETPQLGGEAPIALLDTDAGARQVEQALVRLAHGMVA